MQNLLTGNNGFDNASWFPEFKKGDSVQLIGDAFIRTIFTENRGFTVVEVLDPDKYFHNIAIEKDNYVEMFNKSELIKVS